MADDEIISPAKKTLEAELNTIRFLSGTAEGRWETLLWAWPHLYVRVTGRDFESNRVFCHDFHLECGGYPDPGPYIERWAFVDDNSHGNRPAAPALGAPGFVDAMKWDEGIYRAWNRPAAIHNNWAQKRPDEAWRRDRNIVFIMENLYALVSEQAVWLAAHT
jgi:hypothetical protein